MKVLAAVLLAAPLGAVDFDRGVDAAGILGEARAAAAASPSYETDCRTIAVPLGGERTASASLESRDEHGGPVSYHGGASVTVRGAKDAKPWETSLFYACMRGESVFLDAEPYNPFALELVQKGSLENGWRWVYETGYRRWQWSDPAGVTASFDAASGRLVFADRWASHHEGESIEIRYEVKRERNNLRDAVLESGVIKADTAPRYEANVGPVAEGCYVEYRIRRTWDREALAKQRRPL